MQNKYNVFINLFLLVVLFVGLLFSINGLIKIAEGTQSYSSSQVKEIQSEQRAINKMSNEHLPLNTKALMSSGYLDKYTAKQISTAQSSQAEFIARIVLEKKKLELKTKLNQLEKHSSKGLSIFDIWVWFYGIVITTIVTFYKKIVESISDSIIKRFCIWKKEK